MPLRISFKTSPQRVDWATLDATWRLAGELGGWDGAWMNDHLTDMDPDVPGPSLEAFTLLATLVHHVPGVRVGHAVLSNTFRHPVLLAKAATVMDHATGGRFVLGPGRRLVRGRARAVRDPAAADRRAHRPADLRGRGAAGAVLAGGGGPARRDPAGPVLPAGAAPSTRPPPLTPGGPPIFLGGQKPRGIALAARRAAGWLLTGHRGRRRRLLRGPARRRSSRALEAEGRDPADVRDRRPGAHRRRRGRAVAGARRRRGRWSRPAPPRWSSAIPAALGPRGLEDAHRDVLRPAAGGVRVAAGVSGATIRRIDPSDDDAASAAYVRIRNAVTPENTDSLEQIALGGRDLPGPGRPLPRAGRATGMAVGTASTGRIWMYEPRASSGTGSGSGCCPRRAGGASASALYAAVERRRASGRQDRLPDRAVRGARGRPSLPRQPRLRRDRAQQDGPPRARGPAGARRPRRRPGSAS